MITKAQFETETKGKVAISTHKDASFWYQDFVIGGKLIRYSSIPQWDGNEGIQRSEME